MGAVLEQLIHSSNFFSQSLQRGYFSFSLFESCIFCFFCLASSLLFFPAAFVPDTFFTDTLFLVNLSQYLLSLLLTMYSMLDILYHDDTLFGIIALFVNSPFPKKFHFPKNFNFTAFGFKFSPFIVNRIIKHSSPSSTIQFYHLFHLKHRCFSTAGLHQGCQEGRHYPRAEVQLISRERPMLPNWGMPQLSVVSYQKLQ